MHASLLPSLQDIELSKEADAQADMFAAAGDMFSEKYEVSRAAIEHVV